MCRSFFIFLTVSFNISICLRVSIPRWSNNKNRTFQPRIHILLSSLFATRLLYDYIQIRLLLLLLIKNSVTAYRLPNNHELKITSNHRGMCYVLFGYTIRLKLSPSYKSIQINVSMS